MEKRFLLIIGLATLLLSSGCGIAYQASTMMRAERMEHSLKVGESTMDVHKDWGEPDLRQNLKGDTEIWSYAKRANTNDIAATLLYTNAKEGDQGQFIDLTFVDGKLTSWKQATHTMPSKKSTGLSFGIGGPGATTGSVTHY